MIRKYLLTIILFAISNMVYSFPVPTAFLKTAGSVDPCAGSPSAGTICTGGAIFVGEVYDSFYMTTPSGCTDSSNPICAGGLDLTKSWRGANGSDIDIATVANISSPSTPSTNSLSGENLTPLIVADPSIDSDSASDYCENMSFGGYNDWFLGDKTEMALLYCRSDSGGVHNVNYPDEDPDCISVGGKTTDITGFTMGHYFTSSERDFSRAHRLNFNTGDQSLANKSNVHSVRCMRRQDKCAGTTTIGASCPGGAIYAGEFDGGKYAITPGNCTDSATPVCDGGEDSMNKRWSGTGGSSVDIAGVENVLSSVAPSSSSFRGNVNTPVIAAHASVTADSAADYCNDMVYGGYEDWYLPSKSELAYIYCRADVAGGSHNPLYPHEDPNCASIGGKTSQLPSFNGNNYWSSTEGSVASQAHGIQFSGGQQNGSIVKLSTLRVRCVRRF